MIRIGFIVFCDYNWMGGLNYMKNLLFAISRLPEKNIQPIVFIGKTATSETAALFEPYAEVVPTSLLDRISPVYWLGKLSSKIFSSDTFWELALTRYQIDVFSHSLLYGLLNASTVSWIPDFQHIRLPDMFSDAEIVARNKLFLNLAQKTDLIILSSESSCMDFKQIFPAYASKARVLHFVAQPARRLLFDDPFSEQKVLRKYAIEEKFFFLPNQFWKHKNHRVVFSAMKKLKEEGVDVLVVCSGAISEYRNDKHIAELKKSVEENHLKVKLLGIIDYDDVIVLMKKSIAVINPSLFEGWSSSVEECKSIGKNMILSDIPVHREQRHPSCIFFPPSNAGELAVIMKKMYVDYEPPGPRNPLEQQNILAELEQKTIDFAKQYQDLVFEALAIKQHKHDT